jgi:hypothetical protein
LLLSKNCMLPCYLGITPGKSSWEETKGILTNLGAYSWVETYGVEDPDFKFFEYGWPIYYYNLNPSDPAITPVAYDWDWGYIDQSLAFTVAEDEIKRIQVSITTQRIDEKFREYWKRYALEEIFYSLGEPDKIFLGGSDRNIQYSIHIVYKELSVVLEYDGLLKDNRSRLCPFRPKESGNWVHLKMTLTESNSTLSIEAPTTNPLTTKALYLPIEDMLGITVAEFYNRLQSNSSTCFDVQEYPK